MAIIEGWLPPTRENYDLILKVWQISYPIIGSIQWLTSWYGMGKTSVTSRLNLPGRIGWLTMEAPGFLTLLYLMKVLPEQHGIDDLPWQNKVLAGLFVIHYSYRAVMFPYLQPSMSPVHIAVWLLGFSFQICNATCLGSWLAAYGPTTEAAWSSQSSILQFSSGILIFYLGLSGNFFHDEELRDIRRREAQRQERAKLEQQNGHASKGVEKHYQIPQAGLFRVGWVLDGGGLGMRACEGVSGERDVRHVSEGCQGTEMSTEHWDTSNERWFCGIEKRIWGSSGIIYAYGKVGEYVDAVMIFTSSISNTTQQNTLPSSKIREISPHPKLLPEI
ncbi:hypothetical protein FOXB_15439 [Fusarium oxysporum f. sp. conglutinans Fo5176]|uniref:Steroid 5-alpha reductase C-terminal domain-containing protein n=2 Tax=Fusarium oxysporum f. sp. conglutinans TaxID=100902 RepID=F9G9V7_FUSOF|nr:hypothetical protein FOXB_15439 [Fusarium oxysporum f. sp. conglutinans Fo5176]